MLLYSRCHVVVKSQAAQAATNHNSKEDKSEKPNVKSGAQSQNNNGKNEALVPTNI